MDASLDELRRMKQVSDELAAEDKALDVAISTLRGNIEETDAAYEALVKDTANLEVQHAFSKKEIEMLTMRIEGTKEQIALYDNVVLPKADNELKQSEELTMAKKEYYRNAIENFEAKWAHYQTVYNRFPRVAERNDLAEKVKLAKIEEAKMRQLAVEKKRQAEEMKAMKSGMERLKVLEKELLYWHARDQEARAIHAKLTQEIKEGKAKIREEELNDQQRQEEELRRQQEEERQQQASQNQATSCSPMEVTQDEQNVTRPLTIPTFTVPEFNIFEPELRSRPSLSQPVQSTSVPSGTLDTLWLSSSQPANLQAVVGANACVVTPTFDVVPTSLRPHQLQEMSGKNCGLSKLTPGEDAVQVNNYVCKSQEKNGTPQISYPQKQATSSFGSNKKESILSTDNIAAKMKSTNTPCLKRLLDDAPKSSPQKVVLDNQTTPVPQGYEIPDHNDSQENMSPNFTATDQPADTSNVGPTDMQTYGSEENMHDGAGFNSCNSGENLKTPQEGDQCSEFSGEYGEYGLLESPPSFESPLSPVLANFDSSPARNTEEDVDDSKELQGDTNKGIFSGFNFFQKSSNISFGGQPEKATKDAEKPSKFSFFF